MNTDKKLEDSLLDKNSVYFRSFDKVTEEQKVREKDIINKIKTVFDPEIPVNIYDLGLIYNLDIDKNNNVAIKMTLTTPNCPVADSMPESVGKAVSEIEGVLSIKVELVWEPKWSKDMMSEDAKLALDIF
jgi:FeS assembly SUF system protein